MSTKLVKCDAGFQPELVEVVAGAAISNGIGKLLYAVDGAYVVYTGAATVPPTHVCYTETANEGDAISAQPINKLMVFETQLTNTGIGIVDGAQVGYSNDGAGINSGATTKVAAVVNAFGDSTGDPVWIRFNV